jgi:hypothetical protein
LPCAGAHHAAAREALLRVVLRPPIAQERVAMQQDGLVRLSLKRAFADGTAVVDMDPLSLSYGPFARQGSARWGAGNPLENRPSDPGLRRALGASR